MVEVANEPAAETTQPSRENLRPIDLQSVIDEKDMIELESIDMNLPEEEIIPALMENL